MSHPHGVPPQINPISCKGCCKLCHPRIHPIHPSLVYPRAHPHPPYNQHFTMLKSLPPTSQEPMHTLVQSSVCVGVLRPHIPHPPPTTPTCTTLAPSPFYLAHPSLHSPIGLPILTSVASDLLNDALRLDNELSTWDIMCLSQSVTEVTTKGQWAIHSLIKWLTSWRLS